MTHLRAAYDTQPPPRLLRPSISTTHGRVDASAPFHVSTTPSSSMHCSRTTRHRAAVPELYMWKHQQRHIVVNGTYRRGGETAGRSRRSCTHSAPGDALLASCHSAWRRLIDDGRTQLPIVSVSPADTHDPSHLHPSLISTPGRALTTGEPLALIAPMRRVSRRICNDVSAGA